MFHRVPQSVLAVKTHLSVAIATQIAAGQTLLDLAPNAFTLHRRIRRLHHRRPLPRRPQLLTRLSIPTLILSPTLSPTLRPILNRILSRTRHLTPSLIRLPILAITAIEVC